MTDPKCVTCEKLIKQNTDLKKKYERECKKAKELEEKIEDLKSDNDGLNNQILEVIKEKELHMDCETADLEKRSEIKSLYDKMKSDFDKKFEEIENRIIVECNSMIDKAMSVTSNYSENVISPRRKRPKETQQQNVLIKPSSSAHTNSALVNNGSLKPPDCDENFDDKMVYEMHVSKFHVNTNEKDIQNHIIKQINIDATMYKVIKLSGKNDSPSRNM